MNEWMDGVSRRSSRSRSSSEWMDGWMDGVDGWMDGVVE